MADSRNLILQLLITARDGASGAVDAMRAKLGELGGFVSGALKAGFAALGVAVGAAFKGGLDDAAAFETVMARIRAAGVGSAAELNKLAAAAKRLGAETGAGAVPAAEALENLVKAGLSAEEALAVLPDVIALASGQMMGLSETADLVVNTVNQFGLSFQDSKTIVDTFSAGASAATTSVQDLRQGLENSGLAARTAGLSLKDTIAVVNTLKQSGQGASEAGNALENMLNELGNAASPAREALRSVGVATGDFNATVELLARGGPAATTVLNAFSDTARTAAGILANSLPFYREQVRQLENIKVTAADGAKIMGGTYAESVKALNATWGELWQTLAAPALPKLSAMFAEATAFIRENKQAIGDWISAGLSPLTQSIDGYRLAWALAKGEQEKAAQIQKEIEERTAAIARVLNLSSGEYQKNTAKIKENASAGQDAADAGQQQAEAARAQAEQLRRASAALAEQNAAVQTTGAAWEEAKSAYREAIDTGKGLETATNVLAQRSREYGDALEAQAKAQQAARAAAKPHAASIGELRDAYARQVAEVERLRQANAAGTATAQQVTDAQLKLRRAADDYTGAAQLETRAVADLGEALEAAQATSERNADAQRAHQQAIIALAEARGDDNAAAEAQAALARIELDQAGALADFKRRQADQAAALLDKKRQEYALTIDTNREQQQEVRLLEQTVAQKRAEAREAEAGIAIKERERRQAEIMAGPIGQLARLYAEQAQAHARAADASARFQDAQTREAEGALRLAEIKGDAADIARAQAALDEQIIRQAQALADARRQEAIDTENAISAKVLEMAADGEWTEADRKAEEQLRATLAAKRDAADAAQAHADQLRDEAEAGKEAAKAAEEQARAAAAAKEHAAQLKAAGEAASQALSGWAQRLNELSPAAREAFDGFNREGEKARDTALEIAGALDGLAAGGYVRWANEVAIKALQIEQAFHAQAGAADDLIARMDAVTDGGERAAGGLDGLIVQAESARQNLHLLDQSRLDALQGEIDAANAKLREMQEQAQSAADRIAELNAEIAAEKGDTDTADRLRLQLEQQRDLAEVEANIAAARNAQNRELIALYEEQKRKLNELYDLKERNIEQDREETAGATGRSPVPTGGTSSTRTGGTASTGVAKVYQLNLVGASGQTLTATTDSDPDAFLDALEQAKNRSLR